MSITKIEHAFGFMFLLVCLFCSIQGASAQVIGSNGIWISKAEINNLPTSGASWDRLVSQAQNNTNDPNLSNQDDATDTNTVAKALVYARTGNTTYANEVLYTLQRVLELNPIARSLEWDSLGALRSLGSYAIAADLIDLKNYAPDFDRNYFRPWLDQARFADTEGGRGSLAALQEKRPNNWGAHASASRIAASVYLQDQTDLNRAILVFKGALGDRASYAGFTFGELSWQADPSKPVWINPKGSIISGVSVDGVIPDDARRCGSFSTSLCKSDYMWEGLQGIVAAAEMLHRAGYPAFEWSDRAILRSMQWLHSTTFSDGKNFPAEGDDVWQMYIINKRYGTAFPTGTSSTSSPGKMIGYTDWTHSSTSGPTLIATSSPTLSSTSTSSAVPSKLNLVSSKFFSSTGNVELTLNSAVPGATITVTDVSGTTVIFGTAPVNGAKFVLRKPFYTATRKCDYSVSDGVTRIAFSVQGSGKYGCGARN